LDQGINEERKAKISGNSFVNTKVYFNSDFKLDGKIEMKETNTKHVNYINCMKIYDQKDGKPLVLCTSDSNGYLNYWDV
jgi:hypothetical protein